MLRNLPIRLLAPLALLVFLLGGCSLYRVEIQQGNVVTPEMLESLKIGMTKRQVRFLLGSPLITDPFHEDRWDYYYSLKKGLRKAEQKRLTIYFTGDNVSGVEGDLAPERLRKPEGAPAV